MITITVEGFGDIKLELDRENAPLTVENFEKLASDGFYNGLTFHRIYKGFMIQGGCPKGDGTGGSGTNIKGEFLMNGIPNKISHTKGTISMARSQNPDSASSQFFICDADSVFLDGQYAAFGKVVEGFDVLETIASVPVTQNPFTGEASTPVSQPIITKIIVE
ncbi:MAG: peptidylprolyl isomerase [Bacillota bacterium]|nr:peptidylprolyl isomerase [Bacillota bacterium]